MNKEISRQIFTRLKAANPEPKTELHYNSPFELLIAVILSAQATDKQVNKVTKEFFAKANTPEAILALGLESLKQGIKSIGLYNSKAQNIYKASALLLEKHQGLVPSTREELLCLPGVGRKTANVVLNTLFEQPTIAVDTHIFRVANRTGLAVGKTPLAVEQGLMKIIPKEYLKDAHHWLVLHGRYVCMARKPKCPECILRDLCSYPDKTRPNEN